MPVEAFGGAPLGAVWKKRPALVPEAAIQSGVNITTRDGGVETRPGQHEVVLDVPEAVRDRFSYGKFQGAYPYYVGDQSYIACVVDGALFFIDPIYKTVSLIDAAGDLSDAVDRVTFAQVVNRYLVVQDGINVPIIVDGISPRRSDIASGEVPVMAFMQYVDNRLWGNLPDSNEIIAGDVAIPDNPSTALLFTDNRYYSSGGAFTLPSSLGPVTGMGTLQAVDDSTGVGSVLVFAKKGIFAYDGLIPRDDWETQLIGKVVASGAGCASHYSVLPVDNDVFFRSTFDLRSYRQARAEFSQFGNVPISSEVSQFLSYDTPWLLPFTSAMHFDNRTFITTAGERVIIDRDSESPRVDVKHRGVLVRDFERRASTAEPRDPVWDCVWVSPGMKIAQAVSITYQSEDRGYFITRDEDNRLRLMEQTRDADMDYREDWGYVPIESRIYLRAYSFGNATQTKNLGEVVGWLQDVRGPLEVSLFYSADGYGHWSPWGAPYKVGAVTEGQPSGECGGGSESGVLYPQGRTRVLFGGAGSATMKEVDQGTLSSGCEFQPRVDIKGHARLDKLTMEAEPSSGGSPNLQSPCGGSSKELFLLVDPVNDFEYSEVL